MGATHGSLIGGGAVIVPLGQLTHVGDTVGHRSRLTPHITTAVSVATDPDILCLDGIHCSPFYGCGVGVGVGCGC